MKLKTGMKKFLPVWSLTLSLLFIPLTAKAEAPFSFGYKYENKGFIYTNTIQPDFGIKEPHLKPMNPNAKEVFVSNRNSNSDEEYKPAYAGLKKGEASCINIMGLVKMGNAGFMDAAKNGRISKIYYTDSRKERLYAYYFFYDKFTTIVYGE